MENQINYPPEQPRGNSSGANTVLLVIIILIIFGIGYWWYKNQRKVVPVNTNPSINVDVNLPSVTPQTNDTETKAP